MDYTEIRRLVKLVESSDINELEVEQDGSRLKIVKRLNDNNTFLQPPVQYYSAPVAQPAPGIAQSAAQAPMEAAKSSRYIEVTSPMVGTFYRSPSPEAPPYVDVGDFVKPGQVLCIVEAMKLMNELESEVTGRVAEILVNNAQPVEFGQLLFKIDPSVS